MQCVGILLDKMGYCCHFPPNHVFDVQCFDILLGKLSYCFVFPHYPRGMLLKCNLLAYYKVRWVIVLHFPIHVGFSPLSQNHVILPFLVCSLSVSLFWDVLVVVFWPHVICILFLWLWTCVGSNDHFHF